MMLFFLLLQLFATCSSSLEFSANPILVKGPQDFDGIQDNSSVIVAGSVIQLFCSASGQFNAPRIQWTRNNVTIPETAQLPHLMIKSRTENTTITSSVLTIYGFASSDNGTYQCIASESDNINSSEPFFLSATSSTLKIVRELSVNVSDQDGFVDDRTFVPLGSNVSSPAFLRCSAEHPGPSSAPRMKWLKDGTELFGDDGARVVINTTTVAGSSNRTVSFVRIFNFSQSDAGVYQCVFYDTPSQGGEMITTRPFKVDTGSVVLKFPSTVILHPPDPLVIQVEAGGEYAGIQWMRTPVPLNASNGELVDFQQTYARTVTTEVDWGLYTICLILPARVGQNMTFNISVFGVAASPASASSSAYTSSPALASSSAYTSSPALASSSAYTSSPASASLPASSTSSLFSTILDSSSTLLPTYVPMSTSTKRDDPVTLLLVIIVPICVFSILIILVASLFLGMVIVRCCWKRKDVINMSNPVCLGMMPIPRSPDTSSNSKLSLEAGHLGEGNAFCVHESDMTPNHTYEALPSLPPKPPIFEDLDGSPDCLHVMGSSANVGMYSAVGPTGSEVCLQSTGCYADPQDAIGLLHPTSTPVHRINDPSEVLSSRNSTCYWPTPHIDIDWYQSTPSQFSNTEYFS